MIATSMLSVDPEPHGPATPIPLVTTGALLCPLRLQWDSTNQECKDLEVVLVSHVIKKYFMMLFQLFHGSHQLRVYDIY